MELNGELNAQNDAQQQVQEVDALLGHSLVVPCVGGGGARLGRSHPPTLAQVSGRARAPRPNKTATASVALVVWHKDSQLNEPIFAADARGVDSLRAARQKINSETLVGRAKLIAVAQQTDDARHLPALEIDEAKPSDAGAYTCTIEFDRAPTQTHRARVRLIDPPKLMLIADETKSRVFYSSSESHRPTSETVLVGPFDEGSPAALVCEAEVASARSSTSNSSTPSNETSVTWWRLESVSAAAAAATRVPAPGAVALEAAPNFDLSVAQRIVTMSSAGEGKRSHFRDYFVNAQDSQDKQTSALTLPYDAHETNEAHLRHWRRVESQVSSTSAIAKSNNIHKLTSTLHLGSVSRPMLGAEFMCLASNNKLAPPLNATVRLDLNLKPTEVRIINKSALEFVLNQKTVVECQVFGSRPSAQVRWLRDSDELTSEPVRTSGNTNSNSNNYNNLHQHNRKERHQNLLVQELNRDINNLTKVSYLTFEPQLSDNKRSLACAASNPHFGASSPVDDDQSGGGGGGGGGGATNAVQISDSIQMNVLYAPFVHLKLGTNIKPDSIHVGSSVFMDCNINANPTTSDLVWLFNGQPLSANLSAGILISSTGESLAVQKVRIEHKGSYQCVARNRIGTTMSQILELRPRFKPICDKSLTRPKYEIPVGQSVRIDCHIMAEPSDDLKFTWRFNQSLADTSALGPSSLMEDVLSETEAQPTSKLNSAFRVEDFERFETNFTRSSIMFTPQTAQHSGSLLCSASNTIGEQERPCVIQVIANELPKPVFGCFVDNTTHNSFNIHCQVAETTGKRDSKYSYVIELYKSASELANSPDNNQLQDEDDETASSSGSSLRDTSAQQRQQHSYSIAANLKQQDNLPATDTELNDDSFTSLRQKPVKKSVSQTPTFYVTELDPATLYSAKIYVQSSKGRSTVATYQASTLSLDQQASSGRMQLINKRPYAAATASAPTGLSERVFAYLKSNYLVIGDQTRPWMSVALVVLLCSITVVAVSFFVTRLFCASSKSASSTRLKKSKRDQIGGEFGAVRDEKCTDGRLMQISSEPNAISGRNSKCAGGNGSDTSRETNTDSTLVSSPQTATTENSSSTGKTGPSNSTTKADSCSMHMYRTLASTRRNGSDLRLTSAQITSNDSSDNAMSLPRHHFNRGSFARNSFETTAMCPNQNVGSAKLSTLAVTTDLDQNSNTTQVSIRSGGSTGSNSNADFCTSQTHRFVDTSDHYRPNSEQQVYVISRPSGFQLSSEADPSQQQQQACEFWSSSNQSVRQLAGAETGSTTTTELTEPSNSTMTAYQPINRCSLVPLGGQTIRDQSQLPIGILQNSISIPVALSNHQQPQQSQQHICVDRPRRQLSQEQILHPNGVCYGSENPYLTLASVSSGRLSCQSASEYHHQRQHHTCQQSHYPTDVPPPPSDFAADYRRFKGTFCVGGSSVESNNPNVDDSNQLILDNTTDCSVTVPKTQKHKVKFEQQVDTSSNSFCES